MMGTIYWTPRVLGVVYLLFLAMFSLDIFDGGYGFWGTVVGLFMHNIPVIILAIVLWIAWKREIVGGAGFILSGIFYLVMIRGELPASLIIAGPAFLIGCLFMVGWWKEKS